MAQQLGIPKGTRDFLPAEMQRRDFIFSTIRSVFQLYGFLPVETPAMEDLSTLLGKYGEEGDKLLFRILNSGDFLKGLNSSDLDQANLPKIASALAEKGLRYDLTVPFARFVVMHRNEITFPFRRYQIQPVWRADRPQKGRYREFYQCDADIVGSDSLLNEVELLAIISEVFRKLNLRVSIHINNRKLLTGMAAYLGASDKITDITVAIDKLDKVGLEGVRAELMTKGITENQFAKMEPLLNLSDKDKSNADKLRIAQAILTDEQGQKGIEEMTFLLDYPMLKELDCTLVFDLSLARGLNYYTGTILEVKCVEAAMGSLCGGGRYDNLTGIFGMPGVSGVGMSFGADRIYDIMDSLGRFPESSSELTKVLFVNFGEKEEYYCMSLLKKLRATGIPAEIYPDRAVKIKKQMSYADSRKIPWVVVAGENEIQKNCITVKNMTSGLQEQISIESIVDYFSKK